MSGISRNLNGPYAAGVPNPYTAHVHPYPTRFHGAIYTRPVFELPYVRSPHAVFKPDDFYEYYGVKGLGSLGFGAFGSSLGNGTIGGNTLGLGATGTPIYWVSYNTKVVTLQKGINDVLESQRFGRPLTEDGKQGAQTCAGLSICAANFRADLLVKVPEEIANEAAALCTSQMSNSTIKAQVQDWANKIIAGRAPVPAEPAVTPAPVITQQTATTVTTSTPTTTPTTSSTQAPVITWETLNSQLLALQGALNKILVANRFKEIPVTGKLDVPTCSALSVCLREFREQLYAQAPFSIIDPSVKICEEKLNGSPTLQKEITDYVQKLWANRTPPPEPYTSPASVVPATTAVSVPGPTPTNSTIPVVEPIIAQAQPMPITFDEINVTATPPPQGYGKSNTLLIGLGVLVAGGVGYFLWKGR
jgi:hypothetical protein